MKPILIAIVLLLPAFIVFFVAGSTASSFAVGILAAAILYGTIFGLIYVPKRRRIAVLGAAIAATALVAWYGVWVNLPVPLPADKTDFAGTWTAGPAFTIEIRRTGTVRISQDRRVGDTAWKQLGIEAARPLIETANVYFDQDKMIVNRPMYEYGRAYTIDRAPYTEAGRKKMVLNGVELVSR